MNVHSVWPLVSRPKTGPVQVPLKADPTTNRRPRTPCPGLSRTSPPPRQYRFPLEEGDAEERQKNPHAKKTEPQEADRRRRQPERARKLRDENRRERNDDQHAELLRRSRVVDAGRDHDRGLQRHERSSRPDESDE